MYVLKDKSRAGRTRFYSLLFSACLVFFPAIAFCAVLAFGVINIPLRDDYDTILGFVNGLASQHTFLERVNYLLAAQSNEYKLYMLHGAVWLQWAVMHHLNFQVLVCLGDGFIVLLGIVLWTQFLPGYLDVQRKLLYFVPISCMLFQLRYQEAAVWSTAALQHMPCLFFSFLAIYMVRAPSRGKFCLALACLVLAISSSGNGFLLVPVGVLSLVLHRMYDRALYWTVLAAAFAAVYFQHYTRVNLQAQQPLAVSVSQIHPTYFLLFLGSIAARPLLGAGILLGFLILVFLAYLAFTGTRTRVTSTTYCMAYLLLTAFAVSVLRGNVDPMQISTSRYTIYSALVLIFTWMLVLERRREGDAPRELPGYVLGLVVVASVSFAASTYLTGIRAMQRTNQGLVKGMTWYEHANSGDQTSGPIVPLSTDDDEQRAFERRAWQELTRSVQLGTYSPPPL